MLQFLKYVLATIIGLFVFILLSFFILAGIGSALSSGSDDVTEVAENSVLKIDMNQNISEIAPEDDPFSKIFNEGPGTIGLIQWKEAIANAKLDPNIKGIYLHMEYPVAGFATLQEMRNALLDFKKSGKFIYTYGEVMTEKAIYLASIADKSYLNTAGGLEFNGLSTDIMFMKGLFDKIGVQPVIFRVGEYKSYVEPFIRTDMSKENREQMSSYINSIANSAYNEIAQSRGITKTQIDELLNKALIQTPQDAVTHKLITNVGYFDEFESELKKKLGTKATEKLKLVSFEKYAKAKKIKKEGDRSNQIAVIVGEGDIISGESITGESIGSETIVKELRKARKDSKVKAIVLRINSGGGSALASDVMWREVQLTKKVKPIIASMGDVAASGGYYMAMGCDTIVASPTTITGSIGIFGILFNVQELMNNKLGITFDGVKTHEYANSPSVTRQMSDAEKMMIQNGVNRGYETFTAKAAQGRKMPIANLKALAGGRVWTGEQAKQNGLVDVLGGLEDAIAIAAKKAKLKEGNYRVKYTPQAKSDFQKLMDNLTNDSEDAHLKAYLGDYAPYAKEIKNLQKMDKLQARLPYVISIK
jgi:protease IV